MQHKLIKSYSKETQEYVNGNQEQHEPRLQPSMLGCLKYVFI